MALHPELVKPELAAPGYVGPVDAEFIQRVIREGFQTVTPNGIIGDARGASAAIGEQCLEQAASAIAECFSR